MQFKLGGEREIYKGKFITLWAREFLDKEGVSQDWEYMKKKDAIIVFPVTDHGTAILIKSYRVPVQKYVIEVPAGLADKKGESFEEVGKRELLEEAGYEAASMHALPPWPYRAASSANIMYGFIALGVKKIHEASGDATEDIELLEVPLDKIVDLWVNPPADTFFQPEILGMYHAALKMGIIKK